MQEPNKVLVIATSNQGKVKEFAELFALVGMQVRSLADYSDLPPIVEDGAAFAENARIKAKVIAEHLQVPVLADDSGLCVQALGGAPGVYSARYAGEKATDEENNAKLLRELQSVISDTEPSEMLSSAFFACALALVDPIKKTVLEVEGTCEGYILPEPRGSHGFGYDPLFYLPSFQKTMAELTMEQKNEVSHRAKALRKFFTLFTL